MTVTEDTRAEDTPATPEPAAPSRKDEPLLTISGGMLNYLAVAITFLVVGVLLGMNLPRSGDLTEARVEQIIRNVLADTDFGSPQVVDRFELVDDDPYIGAEDAPIVIVEFSDFECPYCGRHYQRTLEPLLENYGQYIRYVYRDFAIIGPESRPSALAAECAHEQGKFWEFHNAMFTAQDSLGRAFYLQLAADNDLDVAAFTACLDEERYGSEITNDMIDGQLNDVQGTPGFFINGQFIRGAQPYEVFERVVKRELQRAGIDPAGQS
ncbi:MAG: thioredoxin domain-containing protein [Anaerolineae bacterium]|nr:thioredoxin domain-containing protein [Anaerolineae bacterium]